jgi:hypothetical protein
MDDEDFSLNQFDEYLDGHFGEILPEKSDYRFRDDALVNGHPTTAAQRAEMQGRKLVVHNRAAGTEETLVRRNGRWQRLGPSRGLIAYRYSYAPPPEPAKPCPISEHAKANPVRSNLRIPTPRLPNLDAGKEARLIGEAQNGDRGAATKLLDHFHGWLRYAAWEAWRPVQKKNYKMEGVVSTPRKERAETLEDYVAAAALAFWESVCDYKHSAKNRLFAYAASHVYGAISNVSWARKAAGFKDESDLARFIRAHSDAPPAAFKRFFGKYTPLQVYQEIARQGFLVEERDEYSEGSTRDQGSDSENSGCHIEKAGTTKISDDGSFNGPLFLHKHVSQRIEDAARDSDIRALRRLREVGRPAYALELVEKERRHIADCKARDAAEWKVDSQRPYPLAQARARLEARALKAFAKLKKSQSWQEITDGHHDNARRPVHSHHVGDAPRRRRTGG